MVKKVTVKARLHEQRERPEKLLDITLVKGTIVEELDWDSKTEDTKIYSRYYVKDFKWSQDKKDPKYDFLRLTLSKEDMKASKKRKMKIIEKIIKDQYPRLALSFFNSMFDGVVGKAYLSDESVEQTAKRIVKIMNKPKKRKLKEVV